MKNVKKIDSDGEEDVDASLQNPLISDNMRYF